MATNGNTFWTPYKIPPTPNIGSKSWGMPTSNIDPYVLSGKIGAQNNENPSKNTEWNRIPIDHIKTELERIEELVTELKSTVEELQSTVEGLAGAISNINSRLNNASINATCQNGTVVVTLNL
jgi:hypothetical protein